MTVPLQRTPSAAASRGSAIAGAFRTLLVLAAVVGYGATSRAAEPPSQPGPSKSASAESARSLGAYFEQMSAPRATHVLSGDALGAHRRSVQAQLLEAVALSPLPARLPLDVRMSKPLDHPWCTVRRVWYRLWPGVYTSGLLFMPKSLPERPAPAMLCPHGHWGVGNAHPDVQKRCLNFARLGYVTFSSTQNHFEDLPIGVSHQTVMIWTNMRALDYLESLPEVAKDRIGVAGESGGGLQTEMLVATDSRPKAGTVVGLTCFFREIMFPDGTHCACNHFPNVLQFTDHPEISTLGMPAAMQYLTMNDWTATFEKNAFPDIQRLYAANGLGDHVFCRFAPTEHNYDKTKRELTYWWMDRWLRGNANAKVTPEPDTQALPVATVGQLMPATDGDKGFSEIGRLYRAACGYRAAPITTSEEWSGYRKQQLAALSRLLGEKVVLPRRTHSTVSPPIVEGELLIQSCRFASEGGLQVPAIVVRCGSAKGRLPARIVLGAKGKEKLLAETGPGSPRAVAQSGTIVVLPDVRCVGEMAATGGQASLDAQRDAWQRNGIVWGRSIPAMGCTDLRATIDAVGARDDVAADHIELVTRGSGEAAVVALWAAALDPRVASTDVDLLKCCFEKGNLPAVPFVLRHGDVLQWAALVAPRKLVLRNAPSEAGDPAWLTSVFAASGNAAALHCARD